MNQEKLNKELKEHLEEGKSASDILKGIKDTKEKQKPKSIIPTPPPPPNKGGQTQEGDNNELLDENNNLKIENKRLNDDVKFWSRTADNYLKSLNRLTAENINLEEENKELKEVLKNLKKQKLSILEPSRPQPRNMPIDPKETAIIEQAKGHLETLTNSTTLRNRILETEKEGTLNAYWELQTDLREPGEIQQKLLKHFSQNIDNTTVYVYTLAAILRGEYLNEN